MDDSAFDRFAKSCAAGASRRQLLRMLLGVAGSGTFHAWRVPRPSAGSAATPLAIDYFALGDSIAAGHGLGDEDGPDPAICCTPPGVDACRRFAECCQTCRRSSRAYPYRVAELLATAATAPPVRIETFVHHACSGATVVDPENPSLPPARLLQTQVSDTIAGLSPRPALVTMTVGANDFPWFDFFRAAYHLVAQSDDQYAAWIAERAESVSGLIGAEIARLLAAGNVIVVLTDLYNPFNRESWFFNFESWVGAACDRRNCFGRIELGLATINAALRATIDGLAATVAPGRVGLAGIGEGFRGHEAPRGALEAGSTRRSPCCGDAPPEIADTWIQQRYDEGSNSFPCLDGDWRGDCFHPNARGADYIARRVAAVAQTLLPAVVDQANETA